MLQLQEGFEVILEFPHVPAEYLKQNKNPHMFQSQCL